jgi:hypothetical protein
VGLPSFYSWSISLSLLAISREHTRNGCGRIEAICILQCLEGTSLIYSHLYRTHRSAHYQEVSLVLRVDLSQGLDCEREDVTRRNLLAPGASGSIPGLQHPSSGWGLQLRKKRQGQIQFSCVPLPRTCRFPKSCHVSSTSPRQHSDVRLWLLQ